MNLPTMTRVKVACLSCCANGVWIGDRNDAVRPAKYQMAAIAMASSDGVRRAPRAPIASGYRLDTQTIFHMLIAPRKMVFRRRSP